MRANSTVKYIIGGLKNTIAPPRCLSCLKTGLWLCRRCQNQFFSYQQSCSVCHKDHPRGLTCSQCFTNSPSIVANKTHLTGSLTVASYANPGLKRAIHWLKFKGVKDVAATLASLALPQLFSINPLSQLKQEATLVPIPLHHRRAQNRGFNQSFEIARHLSRYTGIPLNELLLRPRATWAQAKLPHELRNTNTDNAFTLNPKLTAKSNTIILIDDVATTGATLDAAALTLKTANYKTIWALTIARG